MSEFWENNKHLFGTWERAISPFSHLLEPILKELQTLSKRGKKIFPASHQTFRAFQECDYNKLSCVVVGLCPYHSITKEKIIVADGIALSCSNTNKEQPSLTKWYNAVQHEFPEQIIERRCDLAYLGHQGILMYNFGLSVENMKATSHNDMWEPFTKALFQEVISLTGVPVVLLGKEVKKVEKWLYPFQRCFKLDHPASAAYAEVDWDSEGVFKNVKQIVKENNNIDITWWPQDLLTTEEEDDSENIYF